MCTPEAGKKEEKEEASRDPKLSVSGDDAQPPAEKEMAISVGNDDAEVDREDNPSWFTPGRLLIIFCIINMLNYLDRGTIASNGVNGSRGTCKESGICTPGSGIQLIGVGLSVWTVAAAGCGCAIDFWSIAICRMFVGVGEASFISLAAPFIDDNAPPAKKTAWLAAFYMCIPTGIAVGYVYGGLVGSNLNWRYAFWLEAILMLPFAILGFVMKPLKLKGFASSQSKKLKDSEEIVVPKDQHVSDEEISNHLTVTIKRDSADKASSRSSFFKRILVQVKGFWKDMKVLLLDQVYVTNVLGYIAYNFVIGAYSFWGPKAGYAIYHMSNADLMFGGITIICGIFGTLAGGLILDRIKSTISNAFKLLSVSTFLGAIFCLIAFWLKGLYGFIALFSVGELLIFANIAGGGIATQEEVKDYNGKVTVFVLVSCIIAATGGLIFGYDIGVSGGVTSMDVFLEDFFPSIYQQMKRDTNQNQYCKFDSQLLTSFTSSLYIAGLISTLFASSVTRSMGRKASILIGGFTFLVGTAINAAAINLAMLLLGRILLGVGIGFANQAVPLYLSEMAPPKLRGALNIGFQLATTIGILAANLVNYGTNKIKGRYGWRISIGMAAIPAVIITLGALVLPDTPNSLIARGYTDEARQDASKNPWTNG
ncbi:hypothetical protein J5N97_022918 [Dioscorea zingiberensis]|uniref:Major facilitator superfamily (MFS) profile domain-containing protein n=1 Tax=Dioscorea zingiberensis TaxID=325984 RepID=A0A9D5CB14_9LILI|nr:hypothetical protein J5N97_022918 [Dioscorea zingiberensis]